MQQFLRDFNNLPKHEFNRKYLLPPAVIAMLLLALWFGSILLTPVNSLTRATGVVANIDSTVTGVKNKPFFKEVSRELRISLKGHQGYFTVATNADFAYITTKLKVGDSATVFYNLPLQVWLFGTCRRIYQLEAGEIIISFDQYKASLQLPLIMLFVFVIGFGAYYMYWKARLS